MKKNRSVVLRVIVSFISVAITTLSGCAQKNDKHIIYLNKKYQEVMQLKEIPLNITSHFPKNITNQADEFGYDLEGYPPYIILLSGGYDSVSINKIEKEIKKIAVKQYSVTDQNLLVILKDDKWEDIVERLQKGEIITPDFKETHQSLNSNNSFEKIYSNTTKNGLADEFVVYIIDSKSRFVNPSQEDLQVLDSLPRNNNDVYSQGVCISKKNGVIIYWTIFI